MQGYTPPPAPLRDAASVVLVRHMSGVPHVLMGRRPAHSAFMPDIYVFPGGAVDPEDAHVPLGAGLPAQVAAAIARENPTLPDAIAAAAIREVWEETGLKLARPAPWPDMPPAWHGFGQHDILPDASHFRYIFRAITPHNRPRRFDARFFIAPADAIAGDPDSFTATTELSDRHWIALTDTPQLNLAPVTAIVLMQAARALHDPDGMGPAPCFNATDRTAALALAAEIRAAAAPLFPTPFGPADF